MIAHKSQTHSLYDRSNKYSNGCNFYQLGIKGFLDISTKQT